MRRQAQDTKESYRLCLSIGDGSDDALKRTRGASTTGVDVIEGA